MIRRISDATMTIVPDRVDLRRDPSADRREDVDRQGSSRSPRRKNAMMKSSKLKVKLRRNPARIAGAISGSVTCRNVPKGVA